jgi:hypothetical protein
MSRLKVNITMSLDGFVAVAEPCSTAGLDRRATNLGGATGETIPRTTIRSSSSCATRVNRSRWMAEQRSTSPRNVSSPRATERRGNRGGLA